MQAFEGGRPAPSPSAPCHSRQHTCAEHHYIPAFGLQVPAEAAAFAQVDKTFKDIMRRTHDRPNALQVCTHLFERALQQ
jgi:hypothetical protein